MLGHSFCFVTSSHHTHIFIKYYSNISVFYVAILLGEVCTLSILKPKVFIMKYAILHYKEIKFPSSESFMYFMLR